MGLNALPSPRFARSMATDQMHPPQCDPVGHRRTIDPVAPEANFMALACLPKIVPSGSTGSNRVKSSPDKMIWFAILHMECAISRSGESGAKIGPRDLGIAEQILRRPLEHDRAGLDHVAVIR